MFVAKLLSHEPVKMPEGPQNTPRWPVIISPPASYPLEMTTNWAIFTMLPISIRAYEPAECGSQQMFIFWGIIWGMDKALDTTNDLMVVSHCRQSAAVQPSLCHIIQQDTHSP